MNIDHVDQEETLHLPKPETAFREAQHAVEASSACSKSSYPVEWFANTVTDEGAVSSYTRQNNYRAALICSTCPIRQECYDYALHLKETEGVWGGTLIEDTIESDVPLVTHQRELRDVAVRWLADKRFRAKHRRAPKASDANEMETVTAEIYRTLADGKVPVEVKRKASETFDQRQPVNSELADNVLSTLQHIIAGKDVGPV